MTVHGSHGLESIRVVSSSPKVGVIKQELVQCFLPIGSSDPRLVRTIWRFNRSIRTVFKIEAGFQILSVFRFIRIGAWTG